MSKELGYYLSAFRHICDYENTACRSDLNYYLCFAVIFRVLLIILLQSIMIGMAIKDAFSGAGFGLDKQIVSMIIFIPFIYDIIHALPLMSLVKRRLNHILLPVSNLLFVAWIMVGLIYFVIRYNFIASIVSKIMKFNFPTIFSITSINYGKFYCLLLVGVIVFLMIREKPIKGAE